MIERAAAFSAKRRFNVDEYRLMAKSGVLPDSVELIDGRIMWGEKEKRFSVAECRLMTDAGVLRSSERHELIDGEIVRMPVAGDYGSRWVEELQVDVLLDDFRRTLATVIVRVNKPIRLSDFSELRPGIALLRPYANLYRGERSHPDDVMLVVEALRGAVEYDDRDRRVPLYAEAGVPELWLINLEEDCIESLTDPVGSGYRVKRRYKRGERIAPVLLSGVLLDVEAALMPKNVIAGKADE